VVQYTYLHPSRAVPAAGTILADAQAQCTQAKAAMHGTQRALTTAAIEHNRAFWVSVGWRPKRRQRRAGRALASGPARPAKTAQHARVDAAPAAYTGPPAGSWPPTTPATCASRGFFWAPMAQRQRPLDEPGACDSLRRRMQLYRLIPGRAGRPALHPAASTARRSAAGLSARRRPSCMPLLGIT
jgi:hypothetical protein